MDTNRPFRFELLPQDASDSLIDLLTDEQLQRDEISPELDDAVSRSLSTSLAFSKAQRKENRTALKVLAELGAEPSFEGRRQLLGQRSFKTSGLCLLLIDESQHLAHSDPDQGLDMARLALHSAETLDPSLIGERVHQDLKAEAWAALGSAHTVLADYDRAELAFEEAETLLLVGSGTLVPRGVLLAQTARLRIEQRRFEDVQRLVDQALPIYRTASNATELGNVLLIKGRLLEHLERTKEAEDCFQEALDLALCGGSQELQLTAQYRLAGRLLGDGKPGEASSLLEETQLLAAALGRGLDRARCRWLRAAALGTLSQLEPAVDLLTEAQQGFLKTGFHFEAAQVCVDLIALLITKGDQASLRQLVGAMDEWLKTANLPETAAQAMAKMKRRALAGNLKKTWIEALAAFLRTCRAHPTQSFSPP